VIRQRRFQRRDGVRVGSTASTSRVRGTKEVPHRKESDMKYMILTYASQQDYDGMAGQASDGLAWSPEDFAAMTSFMEAFNTELADSG
jgi:hypothetical protein